MKKYQVTMNFRTRATFTVWAEHWTAAKEKARKTSICEISRKYASTVETHIEYLDVSDAPMKAPRKN